MESDRFPENKRLISLLNIWSENGLEDDYKLIMHELMHGDCWLLMPSQNSDNTNYSVTISDGNTPLRLTGIYEIDGVKTLGVFTDEFALFNWSKAPAAYTALQSRAVLELCERNSIYNLVINSDSPNIFVAQRKRDQ